VTEYARLRALGVNTDSARLLGRRLAHRAANQRPKHCPTCGLAVQAGNLARHQRTHAREYGWAA